MKTKLSLSARWASYVARYSKWARVTYVPSLALSLALFAMYYLGDAGGMRVFVASNIFLVPRDLEL
jgi:hypothetical protein